MNPRDVGPGRWTATRLPDGRYILAPWDDPVAPAIRRFNAARVTDRASLGDPRDLAAITAWADEREPLEPVRPRLLDLFCCQGGAGTGYDRAGFDVTGIDRAFQPLYPFRFVQADALDVLEHWDLSAFDAIHASPPCQFKTQMAAAHRSRGFDSRADLLTPTRALLAGRSVPYVIENVPGAKAKMRATLKLHGGMFGLGVDRPRLFESNVMLLAPRSPMTKEPVGVYGDRPVKRWSSRLNGDMKGGRSTFRIARSLEEARELMGMPWADWRGCKEAIPPAYAEFIGAQLLDFLVADGLTRTGTGAVA